MTSNCQNVTASDVLSSQSDRVLRRLQLGPMTQLDAWDKCGVSRLAARIFDLRDAGFIISSRTVKVRNRWGETCRVSEYRLEA